MKTLYTLTTLLLAAATALPVAARGGLSRDVTKTTWRKGWAVEAALDMTIQRPYGQVYDNMWDKGRTHGISIGVAKTFSPDITLRARLNWENGIGLFRNDRLQWVAPYDTGTQLSTNMDGGGCLFPTLDVLVSLPNLLAGYDARRRWDVQIIPRMGLAINVATDSWSPLLGIGAGFSYRVAHRTHIFAEAACEATTSDFVSGVPGAMTGMTVSAGCNTMLVTGLGVRIDLGTTKH